MWSVNLKEKNSKKNFTSAVDARVYTYIQEKKKSGGRRIFGKLGAGASRSLLLLWWSQPRFQCSVYRVSWCNRDCFFQTQAMSFWSPFILFFFKWKSVLFLKKINFLFSDLFKQVFAMSTLRNSHIFTTMWTKNVQFSAKGNKLARNICTATPLMDKQE